MNRKSKNGTSWGWWDVSSVLTLNQCIVFSRPVSAYALFFRDTQAAIKGQNPNASFGEVSKIVASMWDVLATEHKNVSKLLGLHILVYAIKWRRRKGCKWYV